MMVKKTLQRFELKVLLRLLIVMYESGHEKRTNLARNAKLSYDTCVSYLDMLEFLGFVKKINHAEHYTYDLTANGLQLCKRKLSSMFDEQSIPTSILD